VESPGVGNLALAQSQCRPQTSSLDLKSVRIGYPDVIPEPVDFCWRSAFKLNGKGSSLLNFARCVLEMLGYEWRLVFWLIPINVWVICETKVHHLSMFPALMLQQDLVVALIRFADFKQIETTQL